LVSLDFDCLDNPHRLEVLRRVEVVARQLPSAGHELLARLWDQRVVGEFGGEHPYGVVADTLRITRAAAAKRFRTAGQLATRCSVTGEPLAPELPAVADAVRAGEAGDEHVQVIRSFLHHLPASIDAGTREQAQQQLAVCASTMRPDELSKVGARLAGYLNPDGTYTERDRARARSVRLGAQGPDLMSSLTGRVDPELRAYLEAVFAKLARPGVCNPDDVSPVVDREPEDDAAQRDTRSEGQRCHDALKAACRALLASGELGMHRGLPVTVLVSTTLRELEDMAGPASTAGGSLLPIRDLVRMAAHAHHYLAVFDGADSGATGRGHANSGCPDGGGAGKDSPDGGGARRGHANSGCPNGGGVNRGGMTSGSASGGCPSNAAKNGGADNAATNRSDDPGRVLFLGRTKRIASADQRIVLHARDIGCSFPGCNAPGYLTEAHHRREWAAGGETDIDNLTLVCRTHHKLAGVGPDRWRTTSTKSGRTAWTPPCHVDPRQRPRVNRFHHPGEVLLGSGSDGGAEPP
jgi:hypothetical protein